MVSFVLVPLAHAVAYLDSTTAWQSNENHRNHKIRVTFSYSGGNGDWVRYFASAESDLGYFSEYSGFSQSVSLSSYGDWVSADYFVILYVVDYIGYALYDSPW
ncbi:MAG: hypothetical protein IJK34_08895 [Clostridia bacterium]|nr:hypothetical protein [Clostridia bacterium]